MFINEYKTRAWPWVGCPALLKLSDGRVVRGHHTGGSWKVRGTKLSLSGDTQSPWAGEVLHVVGWQLDPDRAAHPDTVTAYQRGLSEHLRQQHAATVESSALAA